MTSPSGPPPTLLRAVREAVEMTLREVASAAHVSYSYLAKVERGERTPSPNWLSRVAQAIGTALAGRRAS